MNIFKYLFASLILNNILVKYFLFLFCHLIIQIFYKFSNMNILNLCLIIKKDFLIIINLKLTELFLILNLYFNKVFTIS